MMIGNLTQKRKVKLNRFWVFQIFEVEIERGQMGEDLSFGIRENECQRNPRMERFFFPGKWR